MKKLVSAEVRLCFVDGKGNPLPEEITELKDGALDWVQSLASAMTSDEPPVDWAAEAATAHQELSEVLLLLTRYDCSYVRVEMSKALGKLRAIPGVGAELERRAAGRVTAVPGSERSP